MNPDLSIRNAVVLDGTGTDSFEADISITGDRITAIDPVGRGPSAQTSIDADGQVVAPGFVDVHTHDDGALIRHPGMEFKLAQGCTSVVIGNCGFSAAPAVVGERDVSGLVGGAATWSNLAEFADAVVEANPAVNAMPLIGHNTIRSLVIGSEDRAPTSAELERMRQHVRLAMEQGACGFSTGLVYEPGRFCETEEIIALAKESAAGGGLYATHMRDEGDHLLRSVDEAIRVGNDARLPVQISHHKSAGPANWGKIGLSLSKVDEANAAGADITLDVYPYTAGSGPMAQYFDVDDIALDQAEVIRFASCPAFREYEGRMAVEVALDLGIPVTQLIRDVLLAPEGDRTLCILFVIDEADIEENLRHPRMMVGSDGIPDLRGLPHPRLYGTFPRVLSRYVRDRAVLTLTEAVRRMTSLSCDRFGLVDRGRVAEGQFADLVMFDPKTIADTATYDDPKQEPVGVSLVVVNGQIALRSGVHSGIGGGRFLRYRV